MVCNLKIFIRTVYAFYSLLSFVECIPISVLVKAEYRENTFKSHSKHQESTVEYDDFLNEYNEIKRKYGAEMSVEAPALFSLSGGGSSLFNEVLDVTSHDIREFSQKSTAPNVCKITSTCNWNY